MQIGLKSMKDNSRWKRRNNKNSLISCSTEKIQNVYNSNGYEGRSCNQVALLFDSLNPPQADLRLELPTLVDWKLRGAEERIDHVVIERGPPGGAWEWMDENVLRISLGCWTELPKMNLREWEAEEETRCCRESQFNCDCVKKQQLDKFFLTDSVITHVQRISPNSNSHNRKDVQAHDSFQNMSQQQDYSGKMEHNFRQLLYPDSECLPFICDNNDFRSEFDASVEMDMGRAKGGSLDDTPLVKSLPGNLVVWGSSSGAELCAAHANIPARFHSIPVVQVFGRSVRDPDLIFRLLPQNMYPDCHKIYEMMQDPVGYDNYTASPEHVVTQIPLYWKGNLSGPVSCGTLTVSSVAICIGNQPDLSFLGKEIEPTFGMSQGLPVDSKRNPVSIAFFSHQSTRHPAFYALGPVVAENFVRFLQGEALAVTNHLVRRQTENFRKRGEGERKATTGKFNSHSATFSFKVLQCSTLRAQFEFSGSDLCRMDENTRVGRMLITVMIERRKLRL